MPYADTNMMQLHLDEISRNVTAGVVSSCCSTEPDGIPRASWTCLENITPIFLPSRAPELNPVENVWQYLRQNWLSNTVFENFATPSSTPPASPGKTSSPSLKPSPPSECANGLTSVTRYDLWL